MIKEVSLIGIIGGLLVVKKWWDDLCRIAEPVVKLYEQQAIDGIICRSERKELAMAFIKALEDDKKIKLNFISRLILSKVVDMVANKLPDFKVAQATAKEEIKK